MKTKDLIEQLNKIDPDGVMEVCVDNQDIMYIDYMPAYWDGRLEKITKRDKHGRPEETLITSSGSKIKLYTLDLADYYEESILEEGKEYPIKSIGYQPRVLNRKFQYAFHTHLTLEYFKKNNKINIRGEDKDLIDNIDNKITLVKSLKEEYISESKKNVLAEINNTTKREQKKSLMKLAVKLYNEAPGIYDNIRFGKNHVAHIRLEHSIKYLWMIDKKGNIELLISNKPVDFDIETFDFNEIKTYINDTYTKNYDG